MLRLARTCSTPIDHSDPSAASKAFVGWIDESPGRGTLGLIVTCLFTIFLCTWVVIHPRVCKRPPLRVLHKIALFLKALIAPEFIAVEGLQEWSQAQRMVKGCAGLTGGGLKLVHAFYIGMLALRYRTARGEKVIWPNQYTWLLQEGLVVWDDHAQWGLSEENIRDKSNADGTAKLLALAQVSWFAAQSIMRRAHNLPLSQLESMTLSYIPLFAITYLFWWVKPKDVLTPSVVDLPTMSEEQRAFFESMAVSTLFDEEGIGKQGSLRSIWYLTPRVFEKEAEDRALHEAQQKLSEANEKGPTQKVERAVNLNQKVSVPTVKETVVAHWDPDLYRSKLLWPVICIFGASFGALHLISWHTRFPTPVESWLWRAAALASILSMLVFMQFEKVVLRWGGLLTVISLVSPLLYLLGRLVMVGGVVAAFRASDPAIYETYVVSTYWVHII
ncbi:MAG: hypothetical protein LQ338_001494 [Usnochroma carphineum]|nr:MAG: hypothetical protein LQ338_001494 [Usnochroma carphineum]